MTLIDQAAATRGQTQEKRFNSFGVASKYPKSRCPELTDKSSR